MNNRYNAAEENVTELEKTAVDLSVVGRTLGCPLKILCSWSVHPQTHGAVNRTDCTPVITRRFGTGEDRAQEPSASCEFLPAITERKPASESRSDPRLAQQRRARVARGDTVHRQQAGEETPSPSRGRRPRLAPRLPPREVLRRNVDLPRQPLTRRTAGQRTGQPWCQRYAKPTSPHGKPASVH